MATNLENYQEDMSRLVPRIIGHADRASMDTIAGRESNYPDWYVRSAEVTLHGAEQVPANISDDSEVFHAIENMHRVQALNFNRSANQKERVTNLIATLIEYSKSL